MNCIKYKSGYKYQIDEEYTIQISIKPIYQINTAYIALSKNGELTIRKGYAWDGPSGPTIDTKNFMRGSLVHDALYQLMRENLLPESLRKECDSILKEICLVDGMSRIRAWWVYQGVMFGGGNSANPKNSKKVLYAPKECQS